MAGGRLSTGAEGAAGRRGVAVDGSADRAGGRQGGGLATRRGRVVGISKGPVAGPPRLFVASSLSHIPGQARQARRSGPDARLHTCSVRETVEARHGAREEQLGVPAAATPRAAARRSQPAYVQTGQR